MSYTESTWKTSYDSKENGYYHPSNHLNTFDSSSIYTRNDERFVNNKYQFPDSQTIPRKISKQKIASEHPIDQSNGDYMFESPHRHNEFDPALRHSAGSRLLHGDNAVILTNDFDHQAFHQPNTRKVTKITPKENYSLSNSRPIQTRSASASSGLPIRHDSKTSTLTPNDIQRLKHVRRHEPAHVSSGPASKKSLITPDSWKTYPVVLKKPPNKKPVTETVTKPTKTDEVPKPIVEQSSIPKKPRKRDTSASKPKTTEQTPVKKTPKPGKTKEEKEKIQKYILEKRQEQEKNLSNEKQLRLIQEKERKDKLKKLNEQIKKVAQQPLPSSLVKTPTSTHIPPKDQTEQTRERVLHLLGPRSISEPPTEYHRNTPFEQPSLLERSSSSSSSSSDLIVEIQPPKINQTIIPSHSEPPIQYGNSFQAVQQRHQNILRWAMNLTRDCDTIENKFKYLRPDGTQPFDIIPASHQNLQHKDENLRSPVPVLITNNNNTKPEPIIASKILRPSGHLSQLNKNHTSEYQGQQLPGVGNLRDPLLERRVKRERAATKIQAAYRGYTVRKSMHWINEDQQRLDSDFNKRPIKKSTKTSSYATDVLDTPALSLDLRASDDNFTIGSTLLRNYQRNGINIISSTSEQPKPKPKSQQEKIQRPASLQTYSDDYETITSTKSSESIKQKQIPEKPRVIQQPIPNTESTSSQTTSSSSTSSSSSSRTPTPTPKPHVSSNVQRRRSISPPLPPQMSPDNGRLVHHQPLPHPPPPTTTTTTSRRVFDERRYSPDALERQLNAELHLLDGVEASMKQVENMERLRSMALAQQEVVSLAQVIKNKPLVDTVPQEQTRKFSIRQVSSSSSTSSSSSSKPKHRSPSPHSRRRTTQSTSSSSESILTAREKRVRQKFHSEIELQAYEKRLKDVEQKIRLLVKRDDDIDYQRFDSRLNAYEIFDDKRTVASPRVPPKSSNESSISEDLPSSTSSVIQRKTINDTNEIPTEINVKDNDSFSKSIHQKSVIDSITTDVSDIERRINDYREQLETKQNELEKLKQRKNKDSLRRQEDALKKQLQAYNQEIKTLRHQSVSPKVPTPSRKSPLKVSSSSSSSSSDTSTPTKPQESSIAEELPVPSTASQSKIDIVQKHPVVIKKERDFFDDEEEEKKQPELKPLETPRDERDNTQHDAQSISIATDIAASSETDNDDSRRTSMDNGMPILNLNQNLPSPLKSKEDSESSSSTTTTAKSETSPKQQIQRKSSPIINDYEEDFSEASHSPSTPTKEPLPKTKNDDIDIESIQEDIIDKQSLHDTNQSLSSKSSADEQSEILVLNKKSASNTPRKQDDKTLEEEFPLPPAPLPVSIPQPKIELNNNDDTSHDVSDEEEVNEQENKIDKLTDSFLRTFIDEAIDQGKQIQNLKKETNQKKNLLTQEVKEWMSEDDLIDDDNPNLLETTEPDELTLDLSGIGEKNTDEPRVESPRKLFIEEPIKPFVPHTSEEVIELCHQAIELLFDQNTDFSNRLTIKCKIPNSYFTYGQQDSDTEDIQRNRHAYCQMIFDLCVELLHEMYSENIQSAKYPEWQRTKLVSKRFYRAKKPENRHEIEQFIQTKILELLNLNSRQIKYSKWRVSNGRRHAIEKFETVLDEEIRRTEPQWVNYDDDCTQIKFDVADLIFDQLIQETLTECFYVVDKRLFSSSNSTRL